MLSCIVSLLGWLAVSYGYYRWFDTVFESPGNVIGSLIAGLATWCCVGGLLNAWKAWGDSARVRRFLAGETPRDGALVAICGPLHGTGEVMLAPFSGEQCVVCEYELVSQEKLEAQASSKNKTKPTADYCGFMMTPSVIQTKLGEVRLLGFPQLDRVTDTWASKLEDAERAYLFLQTQEFENRSGLRIVTVVSLLGELWTDDDGFVDKHLKLSNQTLDTLYPQPASDDDETDFDEDIEPDDQFYKDSEHLSEEDFDRALERYEATVRAERKKLRDAQAASRESAASSVESASQLPAGIRPPPTRWGNRPRLIEKRVAPGESVCVIGLYNELHRGLRPTKKSGPPNRLFVGEPEKIAATFRSDARSWLMGSIIGAVIVHLVMLLVIFLYQNSDAVRRDRLRDAENGVKNDNIATVETLYRRGYDLNTPNSQGETHLMQVKSAAMARFLIEHGAMVNLQQNDGRSALTMAVQSGNLDVAQVLLSAGAEVNPRHREWNTTPLTDALRRGDQPMIDLLKQHGATE